MVKCIYGDASIISTTEAMDSLTFDHNHDEVDEDVGMELDGVVSPHHLHRHSLTFTTALSPPLAPPLPAPSPRGPSSLTRLQKVGAASAGSADPDMIEDSTPGT